MNTQPPSTIDLIILGFLVEKPMSAYDLARLIEEKHASKLLKISTPTVYKTCKRLMIKKFLSGKITKKTNQSEKTIYSITKNGEEQFRILMKYFSGNVAPFFLDYNAFLYHIEKLNREDGMEMLRELHNVLKGLNEWMVKHEKEEPKNLTFASRAIVKQYRMTIATLCVWSAGVIRDYKKLK